MSKDNKPVQVSKVSSTDGWKNREGVYIPFDKLKTSELREAIIVAEMQELRHFNLSGMYADLGEKLIAEAERRGTAIKHLDDVFTQNNVEARKNMKNE